jgi:phosphoribosylamine---glycine ligase
VVMAAEGYPGRYDKGFLISGIEDAEAAGGGKVAVFQAGTDLNDGQLITAGGRVLGVTAWDQDLRGAVKKAYQAADAITFKGAYFRRDIAYRALVAEK